MLAIPLLVPFIDRIHAAAIFWLRPSKQIRKRIFSQRQKQTRRSIVFVYSILFLLAMACLVALIAVPIIRALEATLSTSDAPSTTNDRLDELSDLREHLRTTTTLETTDTL